MERKQILEFIGELADELKSIKALETQVEAYKTLMMAFREVTLFVSSEHKHAQERLKYLEDAWRTVLKTGNVPVEMQSRDYDE